MNIIVSPQVWQYSFGFNVPCHFRLFPTVLPYESLSNITAADSALDTVTSLLWAAPRDRQPLMRSLVTNLGKSSFLVGKIKEKCILYP